MRALPVLLVLAVLLPGCAVRPPPPGTPVDVAVVQLYAESARIRVMTSAVGELGREGEDAFRTRAGRTTGIGEHALTLSWANGTSVTLSDLSLARGPDVYFEAAVPYTGFSSCALRAVVRNATSAEMREFSQCGIYREHFVGIGELGLGGGRGNVTVRVWQAPEGRIADWGNGTVQHAPREMALLDGVAFASWSFDVGEGRRVQGTEPPARPAPGTYRFEFALEDHLTVGIGGFRFDATLPDGRRITHEDVDVRLVTP